MLSFFKGQLLTYTRIWNQFWFTPTDLIHTSVIRLLLGGHLLLMYLIRYTDRELFFYADGLINPEVAKLFYSDFNKPLFFLFPESDVGIQVVLLLHLIGLLIFMLGAGNRLIYFGVFLCHLTLLQRNHFVVYGADIFANYWLFYLSLTQCDRYLSIKSWWRNYKKRLSPSRLKESLPEFLKVSKTSDTLSTVGFRLVQIQLCISYAYTGMEKLKGSQWWEGDALWTIMANRQLVPFDLGFLASWPWLIALMTFTTVLWEVYFPFLVYLKSTRNLCLLIGFAFHALTAIFMGLYFFSGVMLITYVVFVEPQLLRKMAFRVFCFFRISKALS